MSDGEMTFDAGWGDSRTVEVEPASDTGFHLGTTSGSSSRWWSGSTSATA